MRQIVPNDFKDTYLVKFYLIENLSMNNITFMNNEDVQLMFYSSTTFYEDQQITIYNSQLLLTNLFVINNTLYSQDHKREQRMRQLQQNISVQGSYAGDSIQKLTNFKPLVLNINIQTENVAVIGFTFIKVLSSFIQITNSEFVNNTSPVINGVVWIQQSQSTLIRNTTFSFNSAGEGGGFYFSDKSNISIDFSKFFSNQALFSGGAILAELSTDIQISNTDFIDNNSLCGGAIRTRLDSTFNCDQYTQHHFDMNKADISGNDWSEVQLLKMKVINIQTFTQNSLSFNAQTTTTNPSNSVPSSSSSFVTDFTEDKSFERVQIYSNGTGFIDGLRSGSSVTIIVQLVDQDRKVFSIPDLQFYNNITNNEFNQMSISIKPNSSNLIIQNDILTSLLRYSKEYNGYIFENVKFKIKEFDYNDSSKLKNENLKFSIDFTSFYGNVSQLIYSFKFQIRMRECLPGEIYQKERSNDGGVICSNCDVGSYSLEDPMAFFRSSSISTSQSPQCKECPQEANLCYKNKILMKDGYWRESPQSDTIIQCYNEPLNCLAITSRNQTFVCKEGHIGPLCESCDNYGVIWRQQFVSHYGFKCSMCNQDQRWDVYMYVAFILIGLTVYMYMQVRNHNESVQKQQLGYYLRMMGIASIYTSCFREGNRYKIKILLYFLQIVNSINRIDFYIPHVFNSLMLTMGSPSTSLSLQAACILLKRPNDYETTIPLMYSQRILAFMSPFMYFLGIIGVHYILLYLRIVNKLSTFFITSFVLLSLYLQPNVIALIVSALSCRKIGEKLYIQSDIQYECFDQYHQSFIYFFFIPAIIFWLIVPLIFLKQLATASRQQRESFKMLYQYGYLYSEYRSPFFFWEFIKILLRMNITICTNLFAEYYQQIQSFNLLIIVIYLIALFYCKPYKYKNLANLDLFTHILLISMILLNLQHNYYLQETEQSITLSVLWMSFLFSYLLVVGYSILIESYRLVLQPFLNQKLSQLSQHFECLKTFFYDENKVSRKSQFIIFKRWRLIHSNLKYLIYLKLSRQTKLANEEIWKTNSPQSQQDDKNNRKKNNLTVQTQQIKSDNNISILSPQPFLKKTLFNSFNTSNLFYPQNKQNNNSHTLIANNQSISSSSSHSLQCISPMKTQKDNIIPRVEEGQSISLQNSQLYESVMPNDIDELQNVQKNKSNQYINEENMYPIGVSDNNIISMNDTDLTKTVLNKKTCFNSSSTIHTIQNLNKKKKKKVVVITTNQNQELISNENLEKQ